MSLLDNRGIASTAERMLESAKRNPEGVLLLAAGAALLLRRTGVVGTWRSGRSNGHYRNGSQERARQSAGEAGEEDIGARAQDMAGAARGYASDIAGRVTRSAEDMAGYTSDMARAAVDRSSRIAHDTGATVRGAMDRMLEEQPLTLALFGLAAGAILASALPATGMERSALGPMGKKLNDAAGEAGERLKKSASRVGERLTEMADEHGLNAKGLREGVREVAQTFSEEMTTDSQDQQRSGQAQAFGGRQGARNAAAGGQQQQSDLSSGSSGEERSRQGVSAATPPSGRMS